MNYNLTVALTQHFTDLGLLDVFTEAAHTDTLARLVWRATGYPPMGNKAEYLESYALANGIRPVERTYQ